MKQNRKQEHNKPKTIKKTKKSINNKNTMKILEKAKYIKQEKLTEEINMKKRLMSITKIKYNIQIKFIHSNKE